MADKMKLSERRKLAKIFLKMMKKSGATPAGSYTAPLTASNKGETSYDYELETPLGTLQLYFATDGNHLHCRFVDVERASKILNPRKEFGNILNPFSGKYNQYCFVNITAEKAWDQVFKPHLERIWKEAGNPFVPWENEDVFEVRIFKNGETIARRTISQEKADEIKALFALDTTVPIG